MSKGMLISPELRLRIYEAGQEVPRRSDPRIAKDLGTNESTVRRYRDRPPQTPSLPVEGLGAATDIRKALKSGPRTAEELADALDCSPRRIRERIAAEKARGGLIVEHVDGRFELAPSALIEPGKQEVVGSQNSAWSHVFGFVTDNHLCNKHSRLDVLRAAYEHFAANGIDKVYNAGNWIDGEHRFNKGELVTAPGMDHQLEYFIENYPQKPGITTFYIAGDDHEGWYQQREGIEIGRYAQLKAETAGRHDLQYLGYAECDVALKCGSGTAIMRVVHPGGGSAYAISYTDQKLVESYQGGEKPHVLLVGHYHKFNVGYPREVHTVQGGCTTDQSLFMRKKRLQAHVGFSVIRIRQRADGAIDRFATEWFPFYDRGYYEKRF